MKIIFFGDSVVAIALPVLCRRYVLLSRKSFGE
jgi:hypothetical protein